MVKADICNMRIETGQMTFNKTQQFFEINPANSLFSVLPLNGMTGSSCIVIRLDDLAQNIAYQGIISPNKTVLYG